MIAFPEEPNRKISLYIIIKGRLLHFNIMSLGELLVHLQEKKLTVKVLWYKNGQQLSLLSEREKVIPE